MVFVDYKTESGLNVKNPKQYILRKKRFSSDKKVPPSASSVETLAIFSEGSICLDTASYTFISSPYIFSERKREGLETTM